MKRVGVVLALSLSACASTQTVLQKEPDSVFHSARPADQVASCIAEKNGAKVREAAGGSKFIQIKNGWQGITLLFQVTPEAEGSRIELKKFYPLGIATHRQCY